jgi:hypothetical protein
MRVCYLVKDGQKKYLCAYSNGLIPERTIFNTKEVWDVDPDSLKTSWKPNEKDFPVNRNGVIDENEARPGYKKYRIPWHIEQMGWRTVLIRLIQNGAVRLVDIEKVFGADNTPEWAAKLNKQKVQSRF